MTRKKVLKITPVLVALNILVLLVIIGFYGIRFVKYYKWQHKGSTGEEKVSLVDALLMKESHIDLSKGLVFDEENKKYIYKGEVNDNYLSYSGMTFRIMGLDNMNNIVLVSENNVTMMYSGLDKGYNNSYVNKWLNDTGEDNRGIYERNLYNSEKYITYTNMCTATIDDLSKIECGEYNNDNMITLLTLNDYKEAGGNSSYLINGEEFYLSSLDSEKNYYYINEDGNVGVSKLPTKISGVRPVITLSSTTELISGTGKKSDPYIIEKHDIKSLADVYVGNYVKVDNDIFKVVSKDENSIKVAATKVLEEVKTVEEANTESNEETTEEKEERVAILKSFGGSSNIYSKDKGTIGKYLNGTYYDSITSKDYIVDTRWNSGKLSLGELDYIGAYASNVKYKVGMLSLADMYVSDVKNTLTLSRGIESDLVIMVIREDGNIFSDELSSKYNIRPAFSLKSNISIKGGKGTLDDAYTLGDVIDEETKEEK